jgi:hypothetical protein
LLERTGHPNARETKSRCRRAEIDGRRRPWGSASDQKDEDGYFDDGGSYNDDNATRTTIAARRRHAASLSFGDCFAYALAKELAAPLLFEGNDFINADIQPA